jgi:outer membrane protein OmpA-like peptidoglycan-associated protein
MLKKIVLLVLFSSSLVLSAQTSKIKKADKFMSKLSYAYALEIYQKLPKAYQSDISLTRKIGVCYYNLGDLVNAELAFRSVVNSPASRPDDFLLFAEILKMNGKAAESDQAMSTFSQLMPTDSRADKYLKTPNYIEKIEAQQPFFTVSNLEINTKASDFGAYPSGNSVYILSARDRATLIRREWSWNRGQFLDIYRGTIGENSQIFKLQRLKSNVNSKFHEGPLCFSPDGQTVYFTRNNVSTGNMRKDTAGVQNLKLYKSQLGKNGNWLKPHELPFNSKYYSTGHPTLSPDGKTLYFVSDMPGGFGGTDIYSVAILDNGTYGKPVNLGKDINTEGKEMFPWLDHENNLFFSSTGHLGLGGLDVFISVPNASGRYQDVLNLGRSLNSESDDFAFVMIPGTQKGYFSSNRKGGVGDDDIYAFNQIRPFKKANNFELSLIDFENGSALGNASVRVLDKSTGEVLYELTSDQSGKIDFDLDPTRSFLFEVNGQNYHTNTIELSSSEIANDQNQIQRKVELIQKQAIGITAKISDEKLKALIKDVQVSITDQLTGERYEDLFTNGLGEIQKGIKGKNINDQLSLKIELVKPGYFPKTVYFSTKISKNGLIDLSNELMNQLNLHPTATNLAEMIQINPIYFDFNKFYIRPDAAKELDKIVAIMNTYPTMVVELGSHTDCRASEQYNLYLSDQRAKASAEYIKAKITNPERIYGKGYGESKLLNDCACEDAVKSTCPEVEHSKNRRTEFKIISIGEK